MNCGLRGGQALVAACAEVGDAVGERVEREKVALLGARVGGIRGVVERELAEGRAVRGTFSTSASCSPPRHGRRRRCRARLLGTCVRIFSTEYLVYQRHADALVSPRRCARRSSRRGSPRPAASASRSSR
jgi:hypothetical protein